MAKTKKSFSTFFKSVIVQLGLEDDMVEWHKTKDTPESDGFEIKRMGTNDLNARIYLKLDYQPEKYRPSPALAAILDLELVTKPAAILAVWQYIKMHKLQESDEKKIISNDALLKNVFKCDKMTFSEIPLRIDSHLLPPESIELEYLISLDRLEGSSTWEVEVEIDDMTKPRPVAANVMSQQREIGLLDQKIHECSLALKGSLINLKVLEEFASDPIACIHKLMEAHVRDQEIVSGHEPHITLGDLLKPGTFDTEEMEKTIALFLTKNWRWICLKHCLKWVTLGSMKNLNVSTVQYSLGVYSKIYKNSWIFLFALFNV